MADRRISLVDIHVGSRVRAARLALGVSQEELADGLGLSFQQIQKYEHGVNRIGTGRLHAIAKILRVPVTYFFEGVESESAKASGASTLRAITEALSTREGMRIAKALSRIPNPATRRRIADLLEAMVANESQERRASNRM